MTTTTPVSGQSIGTSTNVGNDLFPTKVTLAATTVAVNITLRVTNGTAGVLDARSEVECLYAFSPVSVTAAAAVELLKQNAKYVALKLSMDPSADRAKDSDIQAVSGQYLYLWFNVPSFQAAATLNCLVTEI